MTLEDQLIDVVVEHSVKRQFQLAYMVVSAMEQAKYKTKAPIAVIETYREEYNIRDGGRIGVYKRGGR